MIKIRGVLAFMPWVAVPIRSVNAVLLCLISSISINIFSVIFIGRMKIDHNLEYNLIFPTLNFLNLIVISVYTALFSLQREKYIVFSSERRTILVEVFFSLFIVNGIQIYRYFAD